MKGKVRNIISILLILIGVGLLLFAFKGKWETKRVQDELYDKFISQEKEVNQEENKNNKEEKLSYIDMVNPIAILEIPKINLKVVVAEGTDDEIIKYAVGHFKDTAMPGDLGNFALAGHRNYDTGEFFLRLNKLEVNDDIIVSTHDKTFTYKVTDSFTVAPEDTYVLDKSEDAIITLVTCTYDGKDRLIVKGKLEK
ncbi:class D sortase [Clostridium sp. UBA1056]|uniref:class D sortase n=1 Tax=unclassified Clostridium TaxID=2614128 RepID=UPI00321766A6